MNDRELLLSWQEQAKVETQAIDQVGHYQALAVGLATFCQVCLAALLDPERNPGAVTRSEALDLLKAAVTGR